MKLLSYYFYSDETLSVLTNGVTLRSEYVISLCLVARGF